MFGSSPVPAPERWEPPAGGAIAESTVPRLIALFELRACWFESFPFDVQLPRIEPGRIVLPAEEPGIEPWAGQEGVELPVRHGDFTLGRFVLVPASPTSGVALSSTSRAEAIASAAAVGARIAAAIVAECDDTTPPSGRASNPSFPTADRDLRR